MSLTPALHILIVEDNDRLRMATADLLRAQGHEVSCAVTAEDVDDTPTRDVPDLYLIDVNLPGEDGFSLARRIRHSQPLAGIALLTARGQLSDRVTGYDAGADVYLVKPVEQSELLACLHNLARRLKGPEPSAMPQLVLDSQSMTLKGPHGEASLNHVESILLAALTRAAGQKLERWQAMQLIDPNNKGLVPANLEMRINSLRKKLAACGGGTVRIQTLRGFGYALFGPIRVG